MPKLSVPLTADQHQAIRDRAAQVGMPQSEIARRLLLAWLAGELVIVEGQIVVQADIKLPEWMRQ